MTLKQQFRKYLVLPFLLFGCAPTETELFTETQTLLAQGSGESCDLEGGPAEVNINDRSTCENSLACVFVGADVADNLGIEPVDGMCTCRCDGPPGLGPYCSCLDGFLCAPLIEDVGLEGGAHSYCVPNK
jgi:hypothetical protein